MPHLGLKAHQNNGDKTIKNRYLSSFTTRIINQRKYICRKLKCKQC